MSDTMDLADTPQAAPDKPLIGPAGLKIAMICAIMAGLLIPQFLVSNLVAEREQRQEDARQEISLAWGRAQTVLGPLLAVPYRSPSLRSPDGWERGTLAIPASDLAMTATLAPERRRRGLFEAAVYTARIEISGRFGDIAEALPSEAELDWRGAFLVTAASDQRPSTEAPSLRWGDRTLTARGDGAAQCRGMDELRWPLDLDGPPVPGSSFSGTMELRGTGSLEFVPVAQRARFTAQSDWNTPSYVGAGLPLRATSDETGFRAEWAGGRAERAMRLPATFCAGTIGLPAAMGVALLEPVQTYRMIQRSAKYAALFVLLAMMVYWLFELTAGLHIHLVQYGLLGLSMVLFPLLLLAIAEPAGFGLAYAISTAMVMGQASLYTAAVTGRARLAVIFAGVLAALFGFLYVVLRLESLALLAGALVLFAMLSAVMVGTRRLG
ncbi:cell envelope integrity protein CreD [Roseomonas sp. HJA6]|uniref:Cell envelope integrity protein CreD n=1 Tax=Roseomonas alba TaxID=2846776 RepID=A0ABS7ABF8_9PROT|nr:cell envelope integrity protein CreD [Neoroseomonas alba]MBW6399107.1 cell envelope integrity protein CreD [Neoroseomonas alba]